MDLRAEARWHPSARVQAGRRRQAVFQEPAAADPAARGRSDSRPARGRRDPRRRGDVGRRHLSPVRRHVAGRTRGHVAAARRASRAVERAAAAAAVTARRGAQRRQAVGARVPGRMGRRHRQAARFGVRASALAALAEDEVRGLAGARRRRLHRSARRARRPRRAARRLLRGCRLRVCRQDWNGIRHQAAAGSAGTPRSARGCGVAVHQGEGAAAIARALGPAGDRRPGGVHRMDGARQVAPPAAARRAVRQIRARGRARGAVITHPDKVLFPDEGITKGDLAGYYEAIAPALVPHIRNRPVTMERYPSGIRAKGFWQKDVSRGFPDWLERVAVPKKDGTVHHPLVTDVRSLLWVVNQNTITPHVWVTRAPKLYYPDLCVFDLDPSRDDEPEVLRRTALSLRDLLAELGLPSLVKTSGSKGFHIVVPLDGEARTDDVERFAHGVGRLMIARDPQHLTQEFSKVDRN